MVCVPCIVIPFVLWVFHKYIRPIVMKFLPEKWFKSVESSPGDTKQKDSCNGAAQHQNGSVPSGQEVTAGGGSDKKND